MVIEISQSIATYLEELKIIEEKTPRSRLSRKILQAGSRQATTKFNNAEIATVVDDFD